MRKIKSYFISVFVDFLEQITGYVVDISPIKMAKSKKRSYFDFSLLNENKQLRSVCFSPEKHKLLTKIHQEKSSNIGCEIKNFKNSDVGDLMVTNFTSIKRVKLNFDLPEVETMFTSIADINNEAPLYSVKNVRGMVFGLGISECKMNNGKSLTFRQATLKDATDTIPINFFNECAEMVQNMQSYNISMVRVSKYSENRILKTTDSSKIEEIEDLDLTLTDTEIVEASENKINGKIVSIDIKSLEVKKLCPTCKAEVKPDNNIVICDSCQNMTLPEECIDNSSVGFVVEENVTKTRHPATATLKQIIEWFCVETEEKIEIAHAMLGAKVIVVLNNGIAQSLDKNN